MSVELKISQNIDIKETYNLLLLQINNLINVKDPLITNFSNITAALKQTFEKISWVGFYFLKENRLYLGPFQGKVACTRIELGKGVCGTSALKKETQIVPNVHEFPGHIACDIESNSEIVIPMIFNDKVWLEKICELISNKLVSNRNINLNLL